MYSFCYLHLPKSHGNECVIALHLKQGQSIVTEEGWIFTRTRICAPSNSDVVFCCHKCHTWGGNAQKMRRIKDEITVRRKTIKRISFSHSIEFWGRNHHTVKIYLKYILINCCIDVYHEDCDTCDSKKAKTSVRTRVCARVREGDYKDFHNFFLFILLCSIETTRCFKQNDTSFYEKPHVVL